MESNKIEELPFQTLFQMAQEKYQSLQYQEAEFFYEQAYKKNPHDEILILCYANLLKETDKVQQSRKLLEKSIKEVPTGSYKRYMELAEIYEGVKSIKTYQKGIEEAKKCLVNPFKSTAPQAEIKRDLAQAYAGIAEVCLTDLINQKQAQGKCKEAMELGLQMDKTCIDVKLQISNYLMFKDDFETAKKELIQIHQWIMQGRQEYESQSINTTGKYLIQVEEFQKSKELFQKLHEESSSQLEILYMLAFCEFKLKHLTECEQYLEQYDQIRHNGEIVNQEIQEAVNQMRIQISKMKKEHGDTGDGEEDQWMDVEDDQEEF